MYIENLDFWKLGEKCVKKFFFGGYIKNRCLFKRGSLKNRRLMTMGGGGGVKNLKKLMTSFMNGPKVKICLPTQFFFFIKSIKSCYWRFWRKEYQKISLKESLRHCYHCTCPAAVTTTSKTILYTRDLSKSQPFPVCRKVLLCSL